MVLLVEVEPIRERDGSPVRAMVQFEEVLLVLQELVPVLQELVLMLMLVLV